MKTVVLMRHGEAGDGPSDFDRVLTERGRQQCRDTAHGLLNAQIEPDAILCSAALRTTQSAEIVSEILGLTGPTDARRSLYLAEPPGLLEAIHGAPKEASTLLLVGHNPGLSELATRFWKHEVALATAERTILRRKVTDWTQFRA